MLLCQIFDIAIVRVFMFEDYGDAFVVVWSYDFGVDSSCVAHSFFVLFNCFLCISHLLISYPRVVYPGPSFPFDEVIDGFSRLLSLFSSYGTWSGVEDFFNFEFFLIVDEVRQWRRW